ncbi:MAG: Omp28 family outer membrane lipoprotein [Prevotella sp.]|nr:Omp28 family outer membrane lipoprotein [Prevotella sp.]
MKIKQFYIVSMMVLAGITACDEVDEADRFVPGTPIEAKRKVLVEEFTGQRCTNCPEAQRLLAGILEQEAYQNNVIVVGIHAGSFGIAEGGANTSDKAPGLMQPEGNEYANRWKVDAYPAALFNRTGAPESTTATWQNRINQELDKDAQLNIEVAAQLNANNEIAITTRMASSANIQAKLQLWITESHILSLQIDNGKPIPQYEHNHVYRACVNGTWGEDVKVVANELPTFTHQMAVKEQWKAENLAVVAFVYDDQNGVYQVAECEVETPEAEKKD